MVSNPAGSTTVQNFPTPPVPLTGNALYNLLTVPADADGTLTINFTQPQDSYEFDFTINVGVGTRQMIVEGRRAGLVDPVFTDSIDAAVNFGLYTATGTGIIFDQLILSSTAGHWGIDDLVTTDAVPGVTIVESAASTDVAEAGTTSDTFAIALDSPPANDVRINLTTDGQCTATSPIDFTAGNYAAQTVTVTAIDDAITEAPIHPCTINFAIVTADPDYGVVTIADLTTNVTDNDTPGVTVNPVAISVIEGDSGTYDISLDSASTADVIIDITPDPTQCSTSTNSITFLSGTTGPQTITANATDDAIAEASPHPCIISHVATSADANYNGIAVADVTLNITDNDAPGITVDPLNVALTEGSVTPGTYSITLSTQPIQPVRIDMTVPDGQCTVNPTFVNFPAGTVGPLAVDVTPVDDTIAEGAHSCTVQHVITTTDPAYVGIPVPDVIGNIVDDDVPGVTLNPIAVNVAEGGVTANYTVVLDTQPTAAVTVQITPDAQCTVNGSAVPINLTFNPAAAPLWNVAQTITVAAVDDAVTEGAHTCTISHEGVSGDANYTGVFGDVTGNITDNDIPGYGSIPVPGSTLTINTTTGVAGTATVVISETGNADLDISAYGVAGDAELTVTGPGPSFTIADGGADETLTMTCQSAAPGTFTSVLSVLHNAAGSPATYNVTCNVVGVPGYGSTPAAGQPLTINTTTGVAGTATVVINETGTADLNVTSYAVTGGPELTVAGTAAPFTIVDGGGTETLTVTCQSAAPGTFTGTLTVNHNAAGSPATYNVTCNVVGVPGYGSAPAAGQPLTINTTPGVAGTATVVISETGTADLNVTSYNVTGGPELTVAGTAAPFTIVDGGGTETLTVTCQSAAPGTFTGTLTVNHNATGSPATYNVTCNVGGVPGYGSAPAAGQPLTINTTPGVAGTATVVISETGTADLNVTSFDVT
ncbi:MAG: choice-of-anchor D domain-containing protein, partial [Anaerolineae bacterium]|nr:choice-of-anchor D domain-containing protein [Anaerolineae bacterium]